MLNNKLVGAVEEWSDLVCPTNACAAVNPDIGVEREVLVEVG